MPKPKLISFKICPFVQKSIILLKEKNVDYDIEFIDVYDPPKWFLEISPTGKVPVMQVGDDVLFESSVINEYIDEVHAPSLHPADPIQRAKNRAWMEYTSPMNMTFYQMIMAKEKEAGEKAKDEFKGQLAGLEKVAVNSPWFNGVDFSMVDISAAPVFMRVAFVKKELGFDLLEGLPNCQRWSDALLSRKSVIESVVDDFEEILLSRMKASESWLIS